MSTERRSVDRAAIVSILIAVLLVGPGAVRGAEAQIQTYICNAPGGFGDEAPLLPPVLFSSLKAAANPVIPKDPTTGAPTLRGDLVAYIRDLNAAIQLGKALFWEMQAGSDNKTACATCHYNAGGDVRDRNQLNPGPNGWSSDILSLGPNYTLSAGDFPFARRQDANYTIDNADNIVGSQGIRSAAFNGITTTGAELTTPTADATFNVGGTPVRAVTGKNTPSVINAVFNHRNFHNGRAQPEFNGVNPFGLRDMSAKVWGLNSYGVPTKIDVKIKNASLASQAVGPPLNSVEMSAAGRTFQDLARKLLFAKPLGLQQVSSTDSVLGPLVDTAPGAKGLATSYAALIQRAIQPKWWNSSAQVLVGTKYYSMTEANFALFWGLSIMMYEATLVSDDTPIDRYLAYRAGLPAGTAPDPTVIDSILGDVVARLRVDLPTINRDRLLNGLTLFEQPPAPAPPPNGAGCSLCHGGAEMTNASVRALTAGIEPGDVHLKAIGFDLRMERMFMQIPPVPPGTVKITLDPATWAVTAAPDVNATGAPVRVATYDAGWYNIGVRPTADDVGLDGKDPFGKYLSWVRMYQNAYTDPSFIKIAGAGLGCGATLVNNAAGNPLLTGGIRKTEATDTAGSFKTLPLRNVELNGPYFHNGAKSTLAHVLEFYDDGGDFTNPTLAPLIGPLGLSQTQREDLVAFLLALTDERVRAQTAPFDHPQLLIPNGADAGSIGTDIMIELPAVGAEGAMPASFLPRFLGLNPFDGVTPTIVGTR